MGPVPRGSPSEPGSPIQGAGAHGHFDGDWEPCLAFLECRVTTARVCVSSLPRWMKKPRCGVPDHPHSSRRRRNKRYALTGQKWRQKHITYRCLPPCPPFLALAPPTPAVQVVGV